MLRIKGGKVYDPANGVNGVVQDVCISRRPHRRRRRGRPHHRRHRHGRLPRRRGRPHPRRRRRPQLRPRHDPRGPPPQRTRSSAPPVRRGGIGGATPTTFVTGYLYAGMGWTTVNEAAVPILSARHTHEELRDTPIVDKSCLRADGQQRDPARPDRGRRAGARPARRRLADLGGQGLRRQGGQPRRRRGLEVGQGRQELCTSRSTATSKVTPAKIIAGPGRHRGRPGPAAPAAPALQQPRRPRQLHHHARNHEGPGGQPGAHGPPPVPRLRRRRLAHDALRVGRASPSTSTPTRTSRPTPAPCCSATP